MSDGDETSGGGGAETPLKPPRRGRGRPATPPEELRGRLVDAAERCFEQAPFEDVGIMDIVREAKMSSRSFYRFFENKADVALALARERAEAFIRDMQHIVETSETSLEVVDRMLMTYLRDLPMIVADLQRSPTTTTAGIQGILDEYRQKIADLILQQILRDLDAGPTDELPDAMSVTLVIAGIEGLSIRFNTERRREDLVAMHPQILTALQNLFGRWISDEQKIR